jgi:hypothetical protein
MMRSFAWRGVIEQASNVIAHILSITRQSTVKNDSHIQKNNHDPLDHKIQVNRYSPDTWALRVYNVPVIGQNSDTLHIVLTFSSPPSSPSLLPNVVDARMLHISCGILAAGCSRQSATGIDSIRHLAGVGPIFCAQNDQTSLLTICTGILSITHQHSVRSYRDRGHHRWLCS